MVKSNITTLFFDFDGVFADSEYFYYLAVSKILRKYDFEIDEKRYYYDYGGKGEGLSRDIKTYKLEHLKDKIIFIKKEIKREYLSYVLNGSVKTYHYTQELVDIINKINIKKAIVSNSNKETIKTIIDNNNIKNFDIPIVSGIKNLKIKPAPDLLIYAAGFYKEQTENCLLIDDMPKGINACVTINMPYIVFKNNYNEDFLNEFPKNSNIINYKQLIILLKNYI